MRPAVSHGLRFSSAKDDLRVMLFHPSVNAFRQPGGLCAVLDLHRLTDALRPGRGEPSFFIVPIGGKVITAKDTVFRSQAVVWEGERGEKGQTHKKRADPGVCPHTVW